METSTFSRYIKENKMAKLQSYTVEKEITVNYKFRGIHNWGNCPFNSVDFLKHPHHHQFEVAVTLSVTDSDREFQFIRIQHIVETIIHNTYKNYNQEHRENTGDKLLQELYTYYPQNKYVPYTAIIGTKSCEMIAEDIIIPLKKICNTDIKVSVSEDGHYAGTVIYKKIN